MIFQHVKRKVDGFSFIEILGILVISMVKKICSGIISSVVLMKKHVAERGVVVVLKNCFVPSNTRVNARADGEVKWCQYTCLF